MISAGTIAAFLTLDITDFNRSIGEAIKEMARLCTSGEGGVAMLGGLGLAAGTAAGMLQNRLASAAGESAGRINEASSSFITSMAAASLGVGNSIAAMKSGIKSLGGITPEVSSQSKATANAIKSPFASLGSNMYSLMGDAGNGMINGLTAKKNAIIATAKGIADSVTSTIRAALRIASPSRVMRTIGEQTAQGMVVGLDSMLPDIQRSAAAMAQSVSGADYHPASSAIGGDAASVTERLDRLISLLSGAEQVMQVDGRAFARLIREYS